MFTGDIKGAFLQGDDLEDHNIEIYAIPNRDMRERLKDLIGLQDDEELEMLKTGFGDVRAPRLWNSRATRELTDLQFRQHQLDKCIFMSFRDIDNKTKLDLDSQNLSTAEFLLLLDGVTGLHVDDFLGGGEGVLSIEGERRQ